MLDSLILNNLSHNGHILEFFYKKDKHIHFKHLRLKSLKTGLDMLSCDCPYLRPATAELQVCLGKTNQ